MARESLVVEPCFLGGGSSFFNEFGSSSWLKQVPLDLLIAIVPSIPDESIWIVNTLFRAKMVNFVSGSEPNGALF